MKKILLTLATLILLTSGSGIFAADLKIGIVNLQQVFQNYSKAQAMEDKLKKQFSPQEEKLNTMQKQVKGDIEKYNRDSVVMKGVDKKAAANKLNDEVNKFQTAQNDLQKQVVAARNEAIKEIEKEMSDAIQTVAKEQHYNLILTKASAIYSDESLTDVTNEVIKKIKK